MKRSVMAASAVTGRAESFQYEGTRRFASLISRSMGARDIMQSVNFYSSGWAPARVNPKGEEVAYVVEGSGVCILDGYRYLLEAGTGLYIPPGAVYRVENPTGEDLVTVNVCCPEDKSLPAEGIAAREERTGQGPPRTVRESHRKPIPTGDRTFKVLVDGDLGCRRMTQFVGVIPPGRAPMHHHTYEEAIYILEGEGRLWTESGSAEFCEGSSIYLARGIKHALENVGRKPVRLLGVFYPSGSPAARYES